MYSNLRSAENDSLHTSAKEDPKCKQFEGQEVTERDHGCGTDKSRDTTYEPTHAPMSDYVGHGSSLRARLHAME